jgi:LytR cell envelope-related transcriptional attenuator
VGKHSSPEHSAFLRSLLGWFVPWVLVAVVAGVAVWIAVGALGRGELDASPPPAASSPRDRLSPTPTSTPNETPSPERTREQEEEDGRERKPEPELITEGISIQVLNATRTSGAATSVANRLADLGFEIAVVGEAASTYERTTVFWSSDDSRAAAGALARRLDWRVAPAPANLSRSVPVHVVVGLDEG